MPLKKCDSDGKSGWKWGDKGKCFTGPNGKKLAVKQGLAIEGPENFAAKASESELDFILKHGELDFVTRQTIFVTYNRIHGKVKRYEE